MNRKASNHHTLPFEICCPVASRQRLIPSRTSYNSCAAADSEPHPSSIAPPNTTVRLTHLDATLTEMRGGVQSGFSAKHHPTLSVRFVAIFLLQLLSLGAYAQTSTQNPTPPPLSTNLSSTGPSGIRNEPDPLLASAKSLLDQGKISDADRAVQQYLQNYPASADGHFLRGYILFREVQDGAQPNATTGTEVYRDPTMAAPQATLKEAAAKASLAEFTEGAKYRAPSAFDLKIVALDYIFLGDFVDADKWLTRSLQMNPRDSDGWYLVGRAKYNEGRFDEAAQSFEYLLKLEPKSVKGEDNLGLAYASLGQTEKAISAYKSAIALQADATVKNPGPYLDLGLLLMDQNRPQEAVPFFQQAVFISPKESRHHEGLAQAYSRLDQLSEAQLELETAVSLSPQNSRLHYLLGTVYRKEGFSEKANAEFNRSESLKAGQVNKPGQPPSTEIQR